MSVSCVLTFWSYYFELGWSFHKSASTCHLFISSWMSWIIVNLEILKAWMQWPYISKPIWYHYSSSDAVGAAGWWHQHERYGGFLYLAHREQGDQMPTQASPVILTYIMLLEIATCSCLEQFSGFQLLAMGRWASPRASIARKNFNYSLEIWHFLITLPLFHWADCITLHNAHAWVKQRVLMSCLQRTGRLTQASALHLWK